MDAELNQRYPSFRLSPEASAAIAFFSNKTPGFRIFQSQWEALIGSPFEYGHARTAQKRLADDHHVYILFGEDTAREISVVTANAWVDYQHRRNGHATTAKVRIRGKLMDTPTVLLTSEKARERDIDVLSISVGLMGERAATREAKALPCADPLPTMDKLIAYLAENEARAKKRK